MPGIKRYHFNGRGVCNQDNEGAWVKYEDLAPIVKRAFEDGKKYVKDDLIHQHNLDIAWRKLDEDTSS